MTVSSQNNLFVIEDCQVKYLINVSFATKNSLRQIQTLAHQSAANEEEEVNQA